MSKLNIDDTGEALFLKFILDVCLQLHNLCKESRTTSRGIAHKYQLSPWRSNPISQFMKHMKRQNNQFSRVFKLRRAIKGILLTHADVTSGIGLNKHSFLFHYTWDKYRRN